MREDFEGIREYSKQQHDIRVAKNPERIEYAIKQLRRHDICYAVKNNQIGHFHCWRKTDDKLFQFWAGTGKISGREERGIHNLIDILEGRK